MAADTPQNKKDLPATYNGYKKFGGQQFARIQIGGSHRWRYDEGDWKQTKITLKRADNETCSAKALTQRKHLIQFLRDMAGGLEKEAIHLEFGYEGKSYTGEAMPISETRSDEICYEADVSLNDENLSIIRCAKSGRDTDRMKRGLVEPFGNELFLYYDNHQLSINL